MQKTHVAAPLQRSEAFADFDLNLLRFLVAVVATRSITRAGEQLGLSQPAASRTMGRLRVALKDPVLVRAGAVTC